MAARKLIANLRRATALAAASVATTALAGGDSGTAGMGEMTVTGAQFGMLLGGLAGVGIVVWFVVKAMNR